MQNHRVSRRASAQHTRTVLAIILLVGSGLTAITSAQAADGLAWKAALRAPGPPVVSPNGDILVNTGPGGVPSVESVARAGTSNWAVLFGTDRIIDQDPVFDGFGNAYWTELQTTDSTWSVVSYSSIGQLRWRQSLSAGESAGTPLAVGVDGNVYAVVGDQAAGLVSLRGFAANHGTSLFTPLVISGVSRLFAYPGGLVAAGNEVVYISYSGTLLNQYSAPTGTGFRKYAASATGDVFVTTLPAASGGCNAAEGSALVTKFTPTGGAVWTFSAPPAPHCNSANFVLTALPNGGVLATLDANGNDGVGLTALSSSGMVLWSNTTASQSQRVDVNGRIVTVSGSRFPCRNGTDSCFATQINYLGQATGGVAAPFVLFQQPDPNPGSFVLDADYVAIDRERVYLAMRHHDGGQYTGTASEPALYAVDAAGLAGNYPTSALLAQMPTGGLTTTSSTTSSTSTSTTSTTSSTTTTVPNTVGARYVALGDSVPYGHGLANPGFQARSGLPPNQGPSFDAYPNLVAGRLGLDQVRRPTGCTLGSGEYDQLAVSGATSSRLNLHGNDEDCPERVIAGKIGFSTQPHKAVDPEEVTAANLRIDPPSLVSVQVGANDIEFDQCLTRLMSRAFGKNCFAEDAAGATTVSDEVRLQLNRLETELRRILVEITNESPLTSIAVLTYYQIIPKPGLIAPNIFRKSGLCASLAAQRIRDVTAAYDRATLLQFELNRAIIRATQGLGKVFVVDLASAFDGHELCTAEPWIFADYRGDIDANGFFWRVAHPTITGHIAIANGFEDACRRASCVA